MYSCIAPKKGDKTFIFGNVKGNFCTAGYTIFSGVFIIFSTLVQSALTTDIKMTFRNTILLFSIFI